MTAWMNCPRCDAVVDEYETDCSGCKLQQIWKHDWTLVSEEVFDFMTTGTDPRMPPRSDSG